MSEIDRFQRVREATKRQIMGVFMDNQATSESIDNAAGNSAVLIIKELRSQFQKRLEALKVDLITAKNKQQQFLASNMVKLPKSVRNMKVSEFNGIYKCDLLGLMKDTRETNKIGVSKKRERVEAETPAPVGRNNYRNLETPSRTVRRGEVLYSKNGSPVDRADEGALIATITKKHRGEATIAAANFDLNLGEGKYISLTDPTSVQGLNSELKNAAIGQLKILQDQMASIMQQLECSDDSL